MKFFLTIYICSVVNQQCAIPPEYPKEQLNYYDCVRNGLSESYDILYQGDFSEDVVVNNRLYPKFSCEQVTIVDPSIEENT